MKIKQIILGITGSIAAYKACELISMMRKKGMDVSCVMTKEAEYFITPLTVETLSGNSVYRDMFALPENRSPQHTSLADKADLIVICPASANIIGKLASGVCDDLLTCIIYASKAPVLIAPAMNDNMFAHKIVQENIKKLKSIGYTFVDPIKGRLLCGRQGMGHLAEVPAIFDRAEELLK